MKDLRSLRHEEVESAIDNTQADEQSNTSICLETDSDSDPSPSMMINNQRICAFSSSSEALNSQLEWDDNEEIIAHELTELDIPENNENSEEDLWERRRCKRIKMGDDTIQPPQEIKNEKGLMRYWLNRYELFHKYDEGIQLDKGTHFTYTYILYIHMCKKRKINVLINMIYRSVMKKYMSYRKLVFCNTRTYCQTNSKAM